MNTKIKVTIVDTRCGEIKQYSGGSFSLNFTIGRDLPYLVVIFNCGKKHKCFDLNTIFNGTGCSINKFENWFKKEVIAFDEDCRIGPRHWEVNDPAWFRSCGEDL